MALGVKNRPVSVDSARAALERCRARQIRDPPPRAATRAPPTAGCLCAHRNAGRDGHLDVLKPARVVLAVAPGRLSSESFRWQV
jgi:hypothetical protein